MRRFRVNVNANSYEIEVEELKDGLPGASQAVAPVAPVVSRTPQPKKAPAAARTGAGTGTINAPMPGTVIDIRVTAGESVKANQVLAILEAMKMENEVMAVGDGVIQSVEVKVADQISAGQTMFVLS